MRRILIILFLIIIKVHASHAQISFTTSTIPSTCSANGSITVNVSGGSSPYYYQIISSTSGVIRPVQNVNVFNNLPGGTYNIRVTDNNNLTVTNTAIVSGNYVPLAFTSTQQQSTIFINPLNGKPPYKFTYSSDGGRTYLTPKDSNSFNCMAAGNYLFRIYDSCSNFYSENVLVRDVSINAGFSCIPDPTTNTKSIHLDFITSGNGGYSYHAFGVGYNKINTTGDFLNINRCNKNISVQVTDKCGVKSRSFLVCPSPEYTFDIGCVNFKDHSVTITNVSSGTGLPYQYIANDVASNNTTVTGFPIPGDTILAGLADSCGFRNTVNIRKMKTHVADSATCTSGIVNLSSNYLQDGVPRSFPPTRYVSISGPTSFDVTDTIFTDSSVVTVTNIQTGFYVFKVINACGDEVRDSFHYTRNCFKELFPDKYQTCSKLYFSLEKNCVKDTTVRFTLKNSNGSIYAQNSLGNFTGLSNDSCYYLEAYDYECDTTILDTIFPIRPRLRIFQNACNEVSFGVYLEQKKECGMSLHTGLYQLDDFVLADQQYNTLLVNTSGLVNPVPPTTYWIYGRLPDCHTDTLHYSPASGFIDTIHFCITPTVKQVNVHQCKMAWNIKMTDNVKNTMYTLIGNGVNVQSQLDFFNLDSGRYILKDGCNEQELFLPNYYTFKSIVNPGCPSNASITASYKVDSLYIDSLGKKYFFKLCNLPGMDYSVMELGTSNIQQNFDGLFRNLKTGTFYKIMYKGNVDCNYFSDTLFTPFYKRPSLTATYGLICNGNNATVKASVVGGTPPYTYEVLNSGVPKITTDSTFVIYTGLPLGSAQFRVYDQCGISTDYSTEVLSVNFQPTFKKKCDGQVQLIAPNIFNTTYTWTNKNGDTLGHTPIVYTTPAGDDTFTVTIKHLTCTISKSLFVSDFSSSIVNANAGIDYFVDTTTASLSGNVPITGAVGTWRQIDPSSGNTVFADVHDPNTKVTVDIFPGQYTYVWSMLDTAIGCISEDTVVISFLRCPGIKPIEYSKTVKQSTCGYNGKIDIVITQSSTKVHLSWNTGDTSHTIKNLKDSMYIVTISDETSCTPDIIDTTFITATFSSSDSINVNICRGDTISINHKNYFVNGNYRDTLNNSMGCDSVLHILVNVLEKTASYDTARLCNGEQYLLANGTAITQSGDYFVKLSNSIGCDSTLNYHLTFNPVEHSTYDAMICKGTDYLLPGGGLAGSSGTYSDTLQTSLGCDSIVQTNLTVIDSLAPVNLGPDSTICVQDHLSILLNYPAYVRYSWNDNSTQPEFTISKEGVYYVKVYDGCTSVSDTIQVSTKDCSCNFYIPNAFTPNGDGMNDLFSPLNHCVFFNNYSFSIYSRWNELMFTTNEADAGWDGSFNGKAQSTDTYVWVLEYFDVLQNQKIFKKGSVTLLK